MTIQRSHTVVQLCHNQICYIRLIIKSTLTTTTQINLSPLLSVSMTTLSSSFTLRMAVSFWRQSSLMLLSLLLQLFGPVQNSHEHKTSNQLYVIHKNTFHDYSINNCSGTQKQASGNYCYCCHKLVFSPHILKLLVRP